MLCLHLIESEMEELKKTDDCGSNVDYHSNLPEQKVIPVAQEMEPCCPSQTTFLGP